MNAIMGDTASLSLIGTMIPELLITIIIIVISNTIRVAIKIFFIATR
jgi:cell division protein FtsX